MSKRSRNINKPVRIAEVLGRASVGGVINWLMNFYRNVDRTQIQFDFYTYDPSPFDEEIIAMGGRVFHYPDVVTNTIGAIDTLRKSFKREAYSVVHVHMTTLSFVALFAAELAGVKHRICHAHSTTNNSDGWKRIIKKGLRPFAGIFATELAGCSRLSIDWLYRRNAAKAKLIHNAIDLERFAGNYAEVAAADISADNSSYTIGFIGRFERQKNIDYLLEVFKDICDVRADVRLLLVGEGSERNMLEEKARALGIADRLEIRGWRNDIEKCYREIDVLVMPSLFEGLPMAAVEAQAAGVPCVLSANITAEAAVTDRCCFVPLGERSLWVEAIMRALDEGKSYGECPLIGGDYDIEEEAAKLTDYYLSIVGQGEEYGE